MLDGDSDEQLMARTAAGDQRAFHVLMQRHMRRAIRMAQATLRNAADADDVAQEAFMRVWNKAASFNPQLGSFMTWLYRIVINLALDRLRRPASEALEAAAHVPADTRDALTSLIADEEQAAIAAALAGMPERQRAALALFHFEGLSTREGANVMNLGEKAFESLLIRARAALKQRVVTAETGGG